MKSVNLIILAMVIILVISCDEKSNSDSENDRPCANSQFSPLPDSSCPVEGFINAGARGSVCFCENEFDEMFTVQLGPSIEDPDTILLDSMVYGIMMTDCSTITLFSDNTFGDEVGQIQELSSRMEAGSLEFVLFFNDGPSSETVVCDECFTGPRPLSCDK